MSLIEGCFQLFNGRSLVPDQPESASSPRKDKSYLNIYDSCAALGSLTKGIFIDSQLRLFPSGQDLNKEVLQVRGRFSISTAGRGAPYLQLEVHRFAVMSKMDPESDDDPDDLRTSVTVLGRVLLLPGVPENTTDRFFVLEISEYIRDIAQVFTVQFVMSCFFFDVF
jgi:hypothetical protein